jgi:hypothetical protein
MKIDEQITINEITKFSELLTDSTTLAELLITERYLTPIKEIDEDYEPCVIRVLGSRCIFSSRIFNNVITAVASCKDAVYYALYHNSYEKYLLLYNLRKDSLKGNEAVLLTKAEYKINGGVNMHYTTIPRTISDEIVDMLFKNGVLFLQKL